MPSRPIFRFLAPAVFLAIGLWLVPLTILGPNYKQMPGEPCDTGFSNYVLEHGFKWISGKEASFFSAPFLYPAKDSITFSDNFLATLPGYVVFRLSGLDRERAYQAWFVSLFILNFSCAFWALRRLGHAPAMASLGAYLFAFMAPVIEEVTHPALLHLFPIPLAVCGFILWAQKGSVKAFAGMCAALVLQFYGAFYLGAFLAVALGLFVLAWLAVYRRIAGGWSDGAGFKVAVCVAVSVAALWPLASPYMATAQANGLTRFWSEIEGQLPTFADMFRANPGNLLWGWTSERAGILSFNNAMHVGILPWIGVVMVIVALIRRRTDVRLLAALLLVPALLTALTVNIGGFSLFRFVQWLPVFQSMRALTRVVLVEQFFLILVLLGAATIILEAVRTSWARQALLIGLCVLGVLDQHNTMLRYYGYDLSERAINIALVKEELLRGASDSRAMAFLPGPGETSSECRLAVAAMLASQELGVPVVNGYTSWFPRGYAFFRHTDCSTLSLWLLRNQARTDDPVSYGVGSAGPGARDSCAQGPWTRQEARTELLKRYVAGGDKEDLVWALSANGFSAGGNNELWLGRSGELTLKAGESLTLEGVSLFPLEVRIYTDGKDSGKLSFWGLPNRLTLGASGKDVRYRFVADKVVVNPADGVLPQFPAVSVIFTKATFQQARTAQ